MARRCRHDAYGIARLIPAARVGTIVNLRRLDELGLLAHEVCCTAVRRGHQRVHSDIHKIFHLGVLYCTALERQRLQSSWIAVAIPQDCYIGGSDEFPIPIRNTRHQLDEC